MTTDFEVSDVMKELGVTRIASEGMTIVVVYQDRPIRSTVYKNDFNKTTKSLEKTLLSHLLNNETIQATILIISQGWNIIVGNNIEQNIKEKGGGILKDIEELRRNKISQEEWLTKLWISIKPCLTS